MSGSYSKNQAYAIWIMKGTQHLYLSLPLKISSPAPEVPAGAGGETQGGLVTD